MKETVGRVDILTLSQLPQGRGNATEVGSVTRGHRGFESVLDSNAQPGR
jgi:hypothetical protein